MKERINPCTYYVCANATCEKGIHNVTHGYTCQHCKKYRARKGTVATKDNRIAKKQKIDKKEFRRQVKEYV